MIKVRSIFVTMAIFLTIVAAHSAQLLRTSEMAGVIYRAGHFDVLVIGDSDHSDANVKEALIHNIPALKQGIPALDCLLLELDTSMQPGINAFRKPGDLVRFLKKNLPDLSFQSDVNLIERLLLSAQASGLRVFAVDAITAENEMASLAFRNAAKNAVDESQVDKAILTRMVKSVINSRNAIMADETRKLMKTGICKKPVQIIGSAHLADTPLGVPATSLQKNLSDRGLTSAVGVVWKINCAVFENNLSCERFKEYLNMNPSLAQLHDATARGTPSFILIAK